MDPTQHAAAILRRARSQAGLTQSQLAELAGTSQSAIAAYEAGGREPTLPVLDGMVRASGHVLSASLERDPELFRLVELAAELRETSDEQRRLRLVFEFLRAGLGARSEPLPRRFVVGKRPALGPGPSTGPTLRRRTVAAG